MLIAFGIIANKLSNVFEILQKLMNMKLKNKPQNIKYKQQKQIMILISAKEHDLERLENKVQYWVWIDFGMMIKKKEEWYFGAFSKKKLSDSYEVFTTTVTKKFDKVYDCGLLNEHLYN